MQWPRQNPEKNLINFYGPPGEHQTRLHLPYPHRIAWDTDKTITSFLCHQKVHDSLKTVLGHVLDHYGYDRIVELGLDLWGGCLNVRRMTGGKRLSLHSWGIAVDYDPLHNAYDMGREEARFANVEYIPWWEIWEDEGWTSLGRDRDFDWMHVQAARL